MPSIGHIAVGMAAGQGLTPTRRHRVTWIVWLVAVSCAADLDLAAALFDQPHNTLLGHRGLTHSLGFAVLAAIASAVLAPRLGRSRSIGAIAGFLTYTSHLALDCLNVGSVGVPWFWPLSSSFHSLPWAPIPAVISAADFLTLRGLPVLGAELLLFAPLWLYGLFGKPFAPSDHPPTQGRRPTGWRSRRVERAAE